MVRDNVADLEVHRMHGTGLIRDSGRHPRRLYRALVSQKRETIGHGDLTSFAPDVMDQGECGSCVGHGTACAVFTTLAAQGKPIPFVPSQRRIYVGAREIDRAAANPDAAPEELPVLTDVGTEILSAVEYISQFGVMASDAPVDGYNSDCVLENVNDDVSLGSAEVQRKTLLVGPYELRPSGGSFFDELCLALDVGFAVAFGTFVDSDFQMVGPKTAIVGAQRLKDPRGGGHCMCLLGYETRSFGRTWKVQNSWGTGWGQNGRFVANDAFVRQWWEAFVMDVKVYAK